MNKIRQIQELNKREIENGISPNASWHTDYRDTAFVYFGGLPFELSEGDIITIFSQYGEPVFLKLARDHETGKSKGFGWLKYEDQRSTDLAVDNLGGATVSGRLVHVDHARYKARDDEDPDEFKVGWEDLERKSGRQRGTDAEDDLSSLSSDDDQRTRRRRPQLPALPEERELQRLMDEHDDEDPMKAFLIDEKKKEVEAAQRRAKEDAEDKEETRRHRHHRHHHHHRRQSPHRMSHRSRHGESDDRKGGDDNSHSAAASHRKRTRPESADRGRRERSAHNEHAKHRRGDEESRGHRDRDGGRDRDGRDRRRDDGARHRDRQPESIPSRHRER